MIRDQHVRSRLVAALLVFGAAGSADAQLANASTAATGLGGAYTARAQGYNAVFWNPANLGMPGNPGFSFTLLPVDGQAGIKPIDFNKLSEYSGTDIPKSVREQWLLDVETEGGQKGGIGGGITELGFSLGPIAFQASTRLAGDMNLAPGAVEALLFGNSGRYDSLRTLSLAGSSFQTAVYTTGAVSYGMALPVVPLADFAVGVTAKYTVGHALFAGMDQGSAFGSSDVQVMFPTVLPDSTSLDEGKAGSGFGLDLGAAWKIPGFRFGVSIQNVINTFKWDTAKFAARSGVGLFSADTNFFAADSIDQPYASAPVALRERVAALKFKPVIAGGVSFDWMPRITVSADIRQQVGGGIEVGPESMVGAGAELRLIPFIPLRGGVQMMSGGFGISGGFGLHFLGYEAGFAGYVRKRDGGSESGFTLNAISIHP
jgi:hypothetical protein